MKLPAGLLASCLVLAASCSAAELAISANDNHLTQINGVNTVVPHAGPDSLTFIDLSGAKPTVVAAVTAVPNSVIGPPFAVALTPDQTLALVVCAMKVDPSDPTKQTEDNTLTVVDITAAAKIATLTAGKSPAAVAINRQGTLALVANRGDGSVSAFSIRGKVVTPLGETQVGTAASALGSIAITPDGRHALLTRDGDSLISVLDIDGDKVSVAKRTLRSGFRPYSIEVTRDGHAAVVGNVGFANGDTDTLSVIDLSKEPYRTVETVSVGETPEGIKLSPDGKYVAAVVQNGSTKPKGSPFFHDFGLLEVFRLEGTHLVKLDQGHIGHWSQGAVFSRDNKTILVGNMVEKNIQVFSFDGEHLKDSGQVIPLEGGSASLRSADY